MSATTPVEPPAIRASPTVAGFALRTLAWLPLAFVAWYFTAPVLLYPVVLLVRAASALGFDRLVKAIEQASAVLTFVTTLKPANAAAGAVITVDVNLLLYSFGLPLLAALTLAAREQTWKRHLAVGYAVMLPCIAGCVLADFLKNVTFGAGPLASAQTGFVAWQREAIAFAFQFGSLILPAVAPAVLWVAMHGRFLSSLRHRGIGAAPTPG